MDVANLSRGEKYITDFNVNDIIAVVSDFAVKNLRRASVERLKNCRIAPITKR